MKASITIHHGGQQWLVKRLGEFFAKLTDEVETTVSMDKIGLPWYKEPRDDLEEGFSWELQEGFEISFSEHRKDGSISGASWMLSDYWAAESPPEGVQEDKDAND